MLATKSREAGHECSRRDKRDVGAGSATRCGRVLQRRLDERAAFAVEPAAAFRAKYSGMCE